jgi:hypothetical protein
MLKHRLRGQLPVTVGKCVTAPRSGHADMHAQPSRVSEFAGRPPGGPEPVGAGRRPVRALRRPMSGSAALTEAPCQAHPCRAASPRRAVLRDVHDLHDPDGDVLWLGKVQRQSWFEQIAVGHMLCHPARMAADNWLQR